MNKEIDYLKEHLYEIYKYKKSMKDLTYDMDIEHLLRTCKALDYLQHQLEQKEKVIKEARDYINKGAYNCDGSYILEILDKVEEE